MFELSLQAYGDVVVLRPAVAVWLVELLPQSVILIQAIGVRMVPEVIIAFEKSWLLAKVFYLHMEGFTLLKPPCAKYLMI